jgi:hypothetical protein
VVAGYYADRWLGTEPWLMLVLMILGGIAGVRRLMQIPWSSRPAADPGRLPGPDRLAEGAGTASPSFLRGQDGRGQDERGEDGLDEPISGQKTSDEASAPARSNKSRSDAE